MRNGNVISAVIVATVAAVGCGDDGDETAEACDAFVTIDEELSINEDLEAGVAAIEEFVSVAPDEVGDDVEPFLSLLRADPEAAFESEELAVAETVTDDYALENCADTRIDVEAVNYAFIGVPDEVDAGRVAFNLTNHTQTDEAHEALLLRQNDTSDGAPHEMLMAALEGHPVSIETTLGALEPFTLIGAGLLEPPGGDIEDVFVVDLEPGEYVLACLLPVHSSELGEAYFSGEEIDGEYHLHQGMFVELIVT